MTHQEKKERFVFKNLFTANSYFEVLHALRCSFDLLNSPIFIKIEIFRRTVPLSFSERAI